MKTHEQSGIYSNAKITENAPSTHTWIGANQIIIG